MSEGLFMYLEKEWRHRPGAQDEAHVRALEEGLALAAVLAPPALPAAPKAAAFFRTVVQHAPREGALRANNSDLDWLGAAAAQPLDADLSPWLELLKEPRYAPVAFRALEREPAAAVAELETYWQALAKEARREAVAHAVSSLIKRHRAAPISSLLEQYGLFTRWPRALQSAVAAGFDRCGHPLKLRSPGSAYALEKRLSFGEKLSPSKPFHDPPPPSSDSTPPSGRRQTPAPKSPARTGT
ncbi:MAG TPA: hypothetical protein VGK73_19500 [Polyangiaceae bacterium]